MRRGLNFYEGLAIALLYGKLSGSVTISTVWVLAPLVVDWVILLLMWAIKFYSWDKRLLFWIWKTMLKRRVSRIRRAEK